MDSSTSMVDDHSTLQGMVQETARTFQIESDIEPIKMHVSNQTVDVYADVTLLGQVIMETKGLGFYMCATECLRTVDCHSVNFNKEHQVCQFNSAPSVNVVLTDWKGWSFSRIEQWPKVCYNVCFIPNHFIFEFSCILFILFPSKRNCKTSKLITCQQQTPPL